MFPQSEVSVENLDHNHEALVAVLLALAVAIDGLDYQPPPQRTAKNFTIMVDAVLDELPTMPGNEHILEPVRRLRNNLEIALDKAKRMRGHGEREH